MNFCPTCGEETCIPVLNVTAGLVEVGETSRGYKIYREPNGAGGHRYWSDSIGGGVVIYDTCLASREEMELALKIEEQFQRELRFGSNNQESVMTRDEAIKAFHELVALHGLKWSNPRIPQADWDRLHAVNRVLSTDDKRAALGLPK